MDSCSPRSSLCLGAVASSSQAHVASRPRSRSRSRSHAVLSRGTGPALRGRPGGRRLSGNRGSWGDPKVLCVFIGILSGSRDQIFQFRFCGFFLRQQLFKVPRRRAKGISATKLSKTYGLFCKFNLRPPGRYQCTRQRARRHRSIQTSAHPSF